MTYKLLVEIGNFETVTVCIRDEPFYFCEIVDAFGRSGNNDSVIVTRIGEPAGREAKFEQELIKYDGKSVKVSDVEKNPYVNMLMQGGID